MIDVPGAIVALEFPLKVKGVTTPEISMSALTISVVNAVGLVVSSAVVSSP